MSIDIGIDLGTSKIVLFSGSRIVLEQPSVVTVNTDTWEPLYFGDDAYRMIGRTPESLTTVFPIQRGVIADFNIAESMLRFYIKKAFGNRITKPRVIVAVPTGLAAIQHRSVANAVETAGGRNALIIESPMATAINLEIDFSRAHGSLIVDIGAGITDTAVVSMGGLVECNSAPVASGDFDEAIIRYVRKSHNILIGLQTARNIKKQVGTVIPRPVEIAMQARGRNQFTGLPNVFEVTSSEVYNAVHDLALNICASIRTVIERTPPDMVSDIMSEGIYLTGGGAQIYGMAEFLEKHLDTRVTLCEEPAYTVVRGVGKALKNPRLLENSDYHFRSIQELVVE